MQRSSERKRVVRIERSLSKEARGWLFRRKRCRKVLPWLFYALIRLNRVCSTGVRGLTIGEFWSSLSEAWSSVASTCFNK